MSDPSLYGASFQKWFLKGLHRSMVILWLLRLTGEQSNSGPAQGLERAPSLTCFPSLAAAGAGAVKIPPTKPDLRAGWGTVLRNRLTGDKGAGAPAGGGPSWRSPTEPGSPGESGPLRLAFEAPAPDGRGAARAPTRPGRRIFPALLERQTDGGASETPQLASLGD